jgi:hypothetical protein
MNADRFDHPMHRLQNKVLHTASAAFLVGATAAGGVMAAVTHSQAENPAAKAAATEISKYEPNVGDIVSVRSGVEVMVGQTLLQNGDLLKILAVEDPPLGLGAKHLVIADALTGEKLGTISAENIQPTGK